MWRKEETVKYPWLDDIIKKMNDVPRLNDMCDTTGVTWTALTKLVRDKSAEWGHRGQDLLNLVMLGAAIGYMYAKGENINESQSKYPS